MSLAVLSPYHLTTREPPAMAALLLADEVVTFLPAIAEYTQREAAEQAVLDEPAYMDMIESWRWSMPLWEQGLLNMAIDGSSPDEQIRAASKAVSDDDRYAGLRPLMHQATMDEDHILRSVARDVLRGGPDPAVSVPVTAGLDRFAALHDAVVMRSAAISIAQRAEAKLGERVFAIAIPILLQASAGRLLEMRDLMDEVRRELSALINEAASGASIANAESSSALPDHTAQLWRNCAARWNDRFELHRETLLRPCDDEDDLHVIEGVLSISGVLLPADAVLRSSVAALQALSMKSSTIPDRASSSSTLPALRDVCEGRRVLSLICRPLGRISVSSK